MSNRPVTIEATPNVFDDNLLDIIGSEFKFDHVKGMAELLKNAVDAYRRNGVRQEEQNIIFRFTDQGVSRPIIECIDFNGMTNLDIEKAFKRWGDPNAAKRGNKKIKVYGGHGNGGKFYMRQMFEESRFVTYKNGLLNVFGFNEDKKYGYAKGFNDKKMSPKEALAFAEISSLPMTPDFKKKFLQGEVGFTVVQGIGPEGVKTRIRIAREIDRFKNHPQSRRILLRTNVSVVYNDQSWNALLRPDELKPREHFEEPRIIPVPEELILLSSSEKIKVKMANEKYPAGRLVLKTSADALTRGSKLGELNRIDILGEIGVIGSYPLTEIRVTGFPQAAFVYGEFGPSNEGELSILEDPDNDCVSNDRAKLVVNDTTRALIEWIAAEVDKLSTEIAALEREEQKANQKEITSKFNDVLNEWKNKHMRQIMSDLFGGSGGAGGNGGNGFMGSQVTAPPNGFDFKYPQAEIELDSPEKVTLKVSVPQSLPIGTTISIKSDNKKIVVEEEKVNIKSDDLKSTPDGQDIAFIDIGVVGTKLGEEGIVLAQAGKLTSSIRLKVIEKKESDSGKSFPQVLLSGHNADPLNIAPNGILTLGERDPVVYQRPQDVAANIFWINTASPMASKIYDRFTFNSIQWRNFLFERYIDIFVKEAVHELERKDFENFNADAVDQKIAEVVRRVHESAKDDLEQFLFEENYSSN